MTREELQTIIEGITDEQLQKILDINNSDVEKQKKKFQTQVENLNTQLSEAKETISTLEANKGDTDALQAELNNYKAAEEKRKQDEAEDTARAEMLERFNRAKGENVFSSEYAESGVLAAFTSELAKPENKGVGDAEIFAKLTKDKAGVFQTKNPPVNMGGIGAGTVETEPKTLSAALHERYTKG